MEDVKELGIIAAFVVALVIGMALAGTSLLIFKAYEFIEEAIKWQ